MNYDLTKHEQEYDISAYLLKNYSGLMDRLQTPDTSEMKDFVHENAMNGLYIEIIKYDLTPKGVYTLRIDPDTYINEFDTYGDFDYDFK